MVDADGLARRLEEHLTEAQRILRDLHAQSADPPGIPPMFPAGDQGAAACAIRDQRRARANHFPRDLFQEVGWEILLHLFIASREGDSLSGANLAERSGFPATSIMRWIRYLEEVGLLRRVPDCNDRRALLLELTSQGDAAMLGYLGEIAMVRPCEELP